MNKCLPVVIPPLVGYMEEAHPLSILLNWEETYEWYFSNYIQLIYEDPYRYCNQPIKFFKPSIKSGKVWDAECPWLKYDTITKDYIDGLGVGIIDAICKALDLDKYVIIYLNEYYLPFRPQYQCMHSIHETLIYGYSDEKEEFYGLAYTNESNYYSSFTAKMSEVKSAYLENHAPLELHRRLCFLSLVPYRFYEFNKTTVLNSLKEYVNSIDSSKRYNELINENEAYYYGLDIYSRFIEYLEEFKTNAIINPFEILLEHKTAMVKRIEYIEENGYLDYVEGRKKKFVLLEEKMLKIKTLFMRYVISGEQKHLPNIIKSIMEIREYEKLLLDELIEQLSEEREEEVFSRAKEWEDMAYTLDKYLDNQAVIQFDISILNDKTKGYIGISNDSMIRDYINPIEFQIDARKAAFSVKNDDKILIIPNVRCECGNVYQVIITYDFAKKIYDVKVTNKSNPEESACLCANSISKSGETINSINRLIVAHTNSYRYKISNFYGYSIKDKENMVKLVLKQRRG